MKADEDDLLSTGDHNIPAYSIAAWGRALAMCITRVSEQSGLQAPVVVLQSTVRAEHKARVCALWSWPGLNSFSYTRCAPLPHGPRYGRRCYMLGFYRW